MRYACSHMAEYCQDSSPVTAAPKSYLPMTRAGRRGEQDLAERGGAGLRFCGAGERLLGILRVGPGCGKQGLKRRTPYSRVEQREAGDSVTAGLSLQLGLCHLSCRRKMGGARHLKKKKVGWAMRTVLGGFLST